uniref:CFAP20 domain containing n=1 Tax=Callorhinchus milii TaxID=7868 RepID=A0A4W3H0T2_CALMI
MFKNEYQGGPFVEIFSSQGKDPVAKWKLCGSPAIHKVFDKDVRSYVYVLEGSSQINKMQLPMDSKQTLGLIQRFLLLQLCVPMGQDFSTELLITDLGSIKRRLYLSTIHKELTATPLHAKIPLSIIKRKIWINFCIDLVSFTHEAFKGATFQSLDGIVVTANCKLRKIFTMKLQPNDTTYEDDMINFPCFTDGPTDMIPKSCQLGVDVNQVTQLLNVFILKQAELRIGSQSFSSTDLDQLNSRGTAHIRGIKSQDTSHIAFGTKVLGPQPNSGRKGGAKDVSLPTSLAQAEEQVPIDHLVLTPQDKHQATLLQVTNKKYNKPLGKLLAKIKEGVCQVGASSGQHTKIQSLHFTEPLCSTL